MWIDKSGIRFLEIEYSPKMPRKGKHKLSDTSQACIDKNNILCLTFIYTTDIDIIVYHIVPGNQKQGQYCYFIGQISDSEVDKVHISIFSSEANAYLA